MKNVGEVLDTKCIVCDVTLNTSRSNKRFCSPKCGRKYTIISGSKHIDTKVCIICEKTFTPNKLAHGVKTCGDECSKKNKRINMTKYQKMVRSEFRERFGLVTGNASINNVFLYHQELLVSNKVLLDTLLLIDSIKKTSQVNTKQGKLEYNRKYNGRPVDGYGIGNCVKCGIEFNKSSERNNHCDEHNRYKLKNKL